MMKNIRCYSLQIMKLFGHNTVAHQIVKCDKNENITKCILIQTLNAFIFFDNVLHVQWIKITNWVRIGIKHLCLVLETSRYLPVLYFLCNLYTITGYTYGDGPRFCINFCNTSIMTGISVSLKFSYMSQYHSIISPQICLYLHMKKDSTSAHSQKLFQS